MNQIAVRVAENLNFDVARARRLVEGTSGEWNRADACLWLALAVADGCKWCIALHVEGSMDAGATKDEIIEACFVSVMMAGGPAVFHMQLVMDAIDEYSE